MNLTNSLREFPISFLLRVGSVLSFAALGMVYLGLGSNRELFAGYCIVMSIAMILIELKLPAAKYPWVQAIFDCCGCAIAAQIIPAAWSAIFLVGLITANSRLIEASASGLRTMTAAHAILLVGMLFSGINNNVPGWELQFLAVVAAIPGVIFYSHSAATRLAVERRTAEQLQSIAMIAGGVSHDFNNLLAGVKANAQLAQIMLERGDQTQTERSLSEVLEVTHRATLLTQQLCNLSSGKEKSLRTECDVEYEVRVLVRLLKSVMRDGVSVSVNSDVPPEVIHVDRVSLQRVVMNLVINAGQAVKPPSTINVDFRQYTPELVLQISDRGEGIAEKDLDRIFEPFHSSRKSGNGIGLSSARRLVEDEGGRLLAESTKGRGTKMTVVLPGTCLKSQSGPESEARRVDSTEDNAGPQKKVAVRPHFNPPSQARGDSAELLPPDSG